MAGYPSIHQCESKILSIMSIIMKQLCVYTLHTHTETPVSREREREREREMEGNVAIAMATVSSHWALTH